MDPTELKKSSFLWTHPAAESHFGLPRVLNQPKTQAREAPWKMGIRSSGSNETQHSMGLPLEMHHLWCIQNLRTLVMYTTHQLVQDYSDSEYPPHFVVGSPTFSCSETFQFLKICFHESGVASLKHIIYPPATDKEMRMKIWYHPPSNNGKRSMAILLKSNYDYIVSRGSSTSIVPRFLGNELLFAPLAPNLSTFSARSCIMKSAITRWKWSPLKKPSFVKSWGILTSRKSCSGCAVWGHHW